VRRQTHKYDLRIIQEKRENATSLPEISIDTSVTLNYYFTSINLRNNGSLKNPENVENTEIAQFAAVF